MYATPDEIEAMMEMGIGGPEGKPLDRSTLQFNLAAMERRLTVQAAELKFLATCKLAASDFAAGAARMAEMPGHIVETKELLAAYQAMIKQQN